MIGGLRGQIVGAFTLGRGNWVGPNSAFGSASALTAWWLRSDRGGASSPSTFRDFVLYELGQTTIRDFESLPADIRSGDPIARGEYLLSHRYGPWRLARTWANSLGDYAPRGATEGRSASPGTWVDGPTPGVRLVLPPLGFSLGGGVGSDLLLE